MRIDTFCTVEYKSCFIHTKYVNDHLEVEWQTPDYTLHKANSLVGAKRAITKWYKETYPVLVL